MTPEELAGMTRNQAAEEYAKMLAEQWMYDWPMINRWIMERWSKAGLIYVKERAWKIHEKRPVH